MEGTIKFILLLWVILTYSSNASSQACDGTQTFKKIKIDDENIVSWTVANDCEEAIYQIKEFRWSKWILLGTLESRGTGSNEYSFKLSEACDLYKIRLEMKGNRNVRSLAIENPNPPTSIGYTVGETNIAFTSATRYEIFSNKGIRVLTGCAEKVRVAELKKGDYYLNYGKMMVKFLRK